MKFYSFLICKETFDRQVYSDLTENERESMSTATSIERLFRDCTLALYFTDSKATLTNEQDMSYRKWVFYGVPTVFFEMDW